MRVGADPKSILVASIDNLGDLVFATVLIEPLRRAWPEARLVFWTKRYSGALLEDDPEVEAEPWDAFWARDSESTPARARRFFATLAAIRERSFDLTFILNTEWRRAGVLALAGARSRIGHARRKSRAFLHVPVRRDEAQHAIDDHKDLLRAAGVAESWVREARPRLVVGEDNARRGRAWLERAGVAPHERPIVVHPFSGSARKNWPLEAWSGLLRRIEDSGPEPVVVVRTRAEDPAPLLSQLAHPERLRVDTMDLGVLKAVLARARVCIGNDSGPMHMASALGTPVVALFGPTDPRRVGPAGRSAMQVLHAPSIASIGVEAVYGAVRTLASDRRELPAAASDSVMPRHPPESRAPH